MCRSRPRRPQLLSAGQGAERGLGAPARPSGRVASRDSQRFKQNLGGVWPKGAAASLPCSCDLSAPETRDSSCPAPGPEDAEVCTLGLIRTSQGLA